MNVKRAAAGALAMAFLSASPVVAQNNTTAASPPASGPSDIGPGDLSNFTLKGTVTRPADRPATATPAPPPVPAPATAAPVTARDNPPATASLGTRTAAPRRAADNDLFRRPPTLPDVSSAVPAAAMPPPIADPAPASPSPASDGFSIFPWLVGLLAIAGGALLWFGRQRRQGQRYASAGSAPIDIVRREIPKPRPDLPVASPRPDPVDRSRSAFASLPAGFPAPVTGRRHLPTTLMPQPSPRPDPQTDPIVPGGIVSTGLRPWIDVELSPDRALLDEQGAAIAFEVTLYNSGSAAAREVIVEARLLNAGAGQDVELSAFFTAPPTVSDSIPQIAPYARIPLRSAVRLPRAAISEYDYEGRKLFMPLVAISVRYRWSSGDGQSAVGFLVGQGAAGQEKLAPLRLDRGARSWNGLGARRYEKGVRR